MSEEFTSEEVHFAKQMAVLLMDERATMTKEEILESAIHYGKKAHILEERMRYIYSKVITAMGIE